MNYGYRPEERTQDDQETIFEETLHIKALSHLSNSVKRELAAVIVFEAHTKKGTIRKCIFELSLITSIWTFMRLRCRR